MECGDGTWAGYNTEACMRPDCGNTTSGKLIRFGLPQYDYVHPIVNNECDHILGIPHQVKPPRRFEELFPKSQYDYMHPILSTWFQIYIKTLASVPICLVLLAGLRRTSFYGKEGEGITSF